MSDFDSFLSSLSDEQKQKLMEALMPQQTQKEDSGNKTKQSSTQKVDDDFRMQKNNLNNKRREQVRARKNEWVDTGEDRHIETPYGEKTPRNRQPHKKVDVDCSVCGRSFKTDPRYVYGEYHRCSRCTGR